MTNNTIEDKCISSEIGRAGKPYLIVSAIYLCVAGLVIISGLVLLWLYKDNIWIQRRNPLIILFMLIPLLYLIGLGPCYRLFLNHGESVFSKCFTTNFLLVAVIVTLIIPNTVRIISYHYRVQLNQGLSRLNALANEGSMDDENKRGRAASIYFMESSNSLGLSFTGLTESFITDNTEAKINKMKFKASSTFATRLAFAFLFLFNAISLSFALLSCPVSFLGREDTCMYGFTITATLIMIFPLFPMVGVFFYYRSLTKRAPDPFKMQEEFNQSLTFGLILLVIYLADFLNVGGLKPPSDDLTATLNFKIVQLADVVFLLMFAHAVHYQVYLAHKYRKSLHLEIPIGLNEVLDHPEASEMFKSYLETEFSVETYIIYKMLVKWKSKVTKQGSAVQDEKARNIYAKYIECTDNALSINISYRLKDRLKEKLDDTSSEHYSASLFDPIIRALYEQMESNGFLRFVNTEDYKVFVGVSEPILRDRFGSTLNLELE